MSTARIPDGMTKAELVEALRDFPDDAKVNVHCEDVGDGECWPPVSGVGPSPAPGWISLEMG